MRSKCLRLVHDGSSLGGARLSSATALATADRSVSAQPQQITALRERALGGSAGLVIFMVSTMGDGEVARTEGAAERARDEERRA